MVWWPELWAEVPVSSLWSLPIFFFISQPYKLVRIAFPKRKGVRLEFLLISPHWLIKWFTQRWLSIYKRKWLPNVQYLFTKWAKPSTSYLVQLKNPKINTLAPLRSACKTDGKKVIRQQKNLVIFLNANEMPTKNLQKFANIPSTPIAESKSILVY